MSLQVSSTITAFAPPGTGTVSITVTNMWGTNESYCCPNYYRFTYLPPPPTVTTVSPASGSVSGGTTITIRGTGFSTTTAVAIGLDAAGALRVAGFTIVDDTTITAVTSPAGALGPGTFDVFVINAGGSNSGVTSAQFTYY